ncbi:hypothetical protein PTTG_29236 [Puccinia triticina 1-1 BBBD Race 1]|uniref:Uncharacterized protein n=1 Tax=Puccinia triticina (isolate 1-1 / race 1 (BBBD)) TaxID=630390 RepID=A0A180G641_PUCT1|nr:hypothetical protein PTTG_29236 [Puccinia triticina 1-1 BBBD Race 1]
MAHTMSRLKFNARQSPPCTQGISPTWKAPGLGSTSAQNAPGLGSTSAKRTDPPTSGPRAAPVDSLNGWILESSPPRVIHKQGPGRLNAAGRVLGMEDFLNHCNFGRANPNPQALINIALTANVWSS